MAKQEPQPTRQIYCHECRKYLGEIRDATIRIGTVHYCQDCQGAGKLFDTLFGRKK